MVERVLERRLCGIMSVDEMQFGFMPERGTIYVVFILRRLQDECHAKRKKLYMCLFHMEEAFDRVQMKVLEWAMRKKGIPEGAKTSVRVDSELSHEFEVIVGMHQGSVLSPFLFAVVVDVVTEFAGEVVLSELLYADDLVLMSETIERLRYEFMKWKEAFESKGLKINLGKTKVMVSVGITKDVISESTVDLCVVCSLRVKANSFLFWI